MKQAFYLRVLDLLGIFLALLKKHLVTPGSRQYTHAAFLRFTLDSNKEVGGMHINDESLDTYSYHAVTDHVRYGSL